MILYFLLSNEVGIILSVFRFGLVLMSFSNIQSIFSSVDCYILPILLFVVKIACNFYVLSGFFVLFGLLSFCLTYGLVNLIICQVIKYIVCFGSGVGIFDYLP